MTEDLRTVIFLRTQSSIMKIQGGKFNVLMIFRYNSANT